LKSRRIIILSVALLLAIVLLGTFYIISATHTSNEKEDLYYTTIIEKTIPNGSNNIQTTTQYTEDLEMMVSTKKSMYQWIAEPVEITISIENKGAEDQTLKFPTVQQYDFTVTTMSGKKIYRWSDRKSFAQKITELTIPTGKAVSWTLTWNQKGSFMGSYPMIPYHLILPGKYLIIGQIQDYRDQTQVTIAFGVIGIPEPP
jgi:hypothetical protein